MRYALAALLLLLNAAAWAAPAGAPAKSTRVQCWTDEKGQRACGDRVPPQYAKQERQVFDAQGRVVQTKEREKTADEIAAEAEAKHRAEMLKRDEQKARDYDRFLLGTYQNVKDIERARDERLQIIDGRAHLLERTIADNEKAIRQQKSRIETAGKGGKTPAPALAKKLADLENTLKVNRRLLTEAQADREQTRDKYRVDIERFEALRAARR